MSSTTDIPSPSLQPTPSSIHNATAPVSVTATAPSPSSTDTRRGPGLGNSYLDPDGTSFASMPLTTVLYFIGFIALMIALIYILFVARRDRRRRRRQERNRNAEAGHRTTYRPYNDSDEGNPPGYRSYMLDQPVDPEMIMIVHPQDAHFDHHQRTVESLIGSHHPAVQSTYTTTTTTTTTTLAMLHPTDPTSTSASTSASTSSPVVSESTTSQTVQAPEPAASILSERHLSILRNGLGGSNNIRSSGTGATVASPPLSPPLSQRNSLLGHSRHQESTSSSLSRSSSPSPSHNTTPRSSTLLLLSPTPSVLVHETTLPQQSPMTEVTSSGTIPHPILHRLRSQGPPPYLVSSSEDAPPLPPSYNVVSEAS
ncbi:hypothetical protein BGZ94_002748 [Podila epigama]|nr:hypothetical protein BGZ94_002748 [Podila epigama]